MQVTNLFQKLHDDIELMAPASQRLEDRFMIIEDYNIIQEHYKPFIPGVNIGIQCLEGNSSIIIDNKQYDYGEGDMLVMLSDRVIQYCEQDTKCKIRGVVITNNFLGQIFSSDLGGHLLRSYYMEPVLHLSKLEKESMDSFFTVLKQIVAKQDHPFRERTIQHLVAAMFYGCFSARHITGNNLTKNRTTDIYEQFMSLLRKNFRQESGIQYYADAICITPKYLSNVIKQASGKYASEWIDFYRITEAKTLVENTNLNFSQIAEKLNFSDISAFGKFFKRMTGESPRSYKSNLIRH